MHFRNLNLDTYGVDLSLESPNYYPELNISVCDVEHEKLPFPNNFFDVVYSKSFLEYLYYPERFGKGAYRLLKPGGLF